MIATDPVIEIDATGPPAERLRRLVRRTLEQEGRQLDRVSVSFVDETTIERLNREHRGKAKPTDVLSWPFDAGFPQGSGGEVVICSAQADPPGPATEDRLLVHGVLHVLGYEDDTDTGLADMERRTDRVLEGFNG